MSLNERNIENGRILKLLHKHKQGKHASWTSAALLPFQSDFGVTLLDQQ